MSQSPPETAPLQSRGKLKDKFRAVVAIPCCNEFDTLPETLKSLEATGPLLEEVLIIVNVNQRGSMDSANNLATLEWLQQFESPLPLAWLDHVTDGRAYPEKFGVGLARHQACTVGMSFIDETAPIISLDADSPVDSNYFTAIFDFIAHHPNFRAGHVNFKHRHCGTADEKRAIVIYEQHLKRHRQKLQDANSPHAYYAIGSTILCTKQAYIKSGGYHRRRMAGEDFYLLQQLSKTGCKIEMIQEAIVFPSDRVSDRVPFGTGKAVGDILQSGNWLTYHDYCYRDLGLLLEAVENGVSHSAADILQNVPQSCAGWLVSRKFENVWPKLNANSTGSEMLLQRFHEWLDAFQTLKLIHFLSDNTYPRVPVSLKTNPIDSNH
jgi:GT2 family glycosyltransferase